MATSSLAYDLSRFETHPVEEKPQPQIRKVAKTAQKTSARVNPLKAVITMVLVIGVTFALLYTRVQLTERISEISAATSEFTELEAQGTQMDLKLEGMVSPKKVQEYATNQLGMIESSEKNVEYIRLTQENKIEVPEGAAGTVWERIGSFFTGILS